MINERLKRARVAAEKTQKELADFLKISPQSVSKWEMGSSLPSVAMLPLIAEYFDCPVNAFFSDFEIEVFENVMKHAIKKEDLTDWLLEMAFGSEDEESDDAVRKKRDINEVTTPVDMLFSHGVYKIVSREEIISCALLQRKLNVGFGIAATIVDGLENLGVVVRDAKTGKRHVIKEKIHLLDRFL